MWTQIVEMQNIQLAAVCPELWLWPGHINIVQCVWRWNILSSFRKKLDISNVCPYCAMKWILNRETKKKKKDKNDRDIHIHETLIHTTATIPMIYEREKQVKKN